MSLPVKQACRPPHPLLSHRRLAAITFLAQGPLQLSPLGEVLPVDLGGLLPHAFITCYLLQEAILSVKQHPPLTTAQSPSDPLYY